MTIYFMGGEMSALIPSDATTTEVTNFGYFNPSFTRCAASSGEGAGGVATAFIDSPVLALPDEFYVHYDVTRDPTYSNNGNQLVLVSGATEVFRVQCTRTALQMQALIAAVWTNVGASVSYSGSTLQTIDLYINGNSATGTAKLYVAGTLRATASSVDLSAVTGITKVRSYCINNSTGFFLSQIVVANEPTIGMRLLTRYPNAAGATTDWTGGYTDVDEIVYDDADFVNSSTDGQVELFTQTGPAITGYTVRAVAVYARAKKGASGPSNLQLALRSGGTTYFSGSKALDVGYSAYGNIWETNPATAAAWVNTAIDALQPGVKAVT